MSNPENAIGKPEWTASLSPVAWCEEALRETQTFCSDTLKNPMGRLRQGEVAIDGLVVGGMKDIPNELKNKPVETMTKAAVSAALGFGLGTALAAESPLIVGGAILASGVGLGLGVKSGWDWLTGNKTLADTMNVAFKVDDNRAMQSCKQSAEEQLGPVAFDAGLSTLAGTGGFLGSKSGSGLLASLFRSKSECVPGLTEEELQFCRWTKQPDGSKFIYTRAYSGNTIKLTDLPDGSYVFEGDLNGQLVRESQLSDGIRTVEKSKDGNFVSKTIRYPDGKREEIHAGGFKYIWHPDGSSENHYPDGTFTTTGPREATLAGQAQELSPKPFAKDISPILPGPGGDTPKYPYPFGEPPFNAEHGR